MILWALSSQRVNLMDLYPGLFLNVNSEDNFFYEYLNYPVILLIVQKDLSKI